MEVDKSKNEQKTHWLTEEKTKQTKYVDKTTNHWAWTLLKASHRAAGHSQCLPNTISKFSVKSQIKTNITSFAVCLQHKILPFCTQNLWVFSCLIFLLSHYLHTWFGQRYRIARIIWSTKQKSIWMWINKDILFIHPNYVKRYRFSIFGEKKNHKSSLNYWMIVFHCTHNKEKKTNAKRN